MKHLKLFEEFTNKVYYHGSYDELPIGTVLKPHEYSYTKQEDNSNLEKIMEMYRT